MVWWQQLLLLAVPPFQGTPSDSHKPRAARGMGRGLMLRIRSVQPLLLFSSHKSLQSTAVPVQLWHHTASTAVHALAAVAVVFPVPPAKQPRRRLTTTWRCLLPQIYTLNRRVQAQNRAPDDFPGFIREGFDITVIGEGYQIDPTNG